MHHTAFDVNIFCSEVLISRLLTMNDSNLDMYIGRLVRAIYVANFQLRSTSNYIRVVEGLVMRDHVRMRPYILRISEAIVPRNPQFLSKMLNLYPKIHKSVHVDLVGILNKGYVNTFTKLVHGGHDILNLDYSRLRKEFLPVFIQVKWYALVRKIIARVRFSNSVQRWKRKVYQPGEGTLFFKLNENFTKLVDRI